MARVRFFTVGVLCQIACNSWQRSTYSSCHQQVWDTAGDSHAIGNWDSPGLGTCSQPRVDLQVKQNRWSTCADATPKVYSIIGSRPMAVVHRAIGPHSTLISILHSKLVSRKLWYIRSAPMFTSLSTGKSLVRQLVSGSSLSSTYSDRWSMCSTIVLSPTERCIVTVTPEGRPTTRYGPDPLTLPFI